MISKPIETPIQTPTNTWQAPVVEKLAAEPVVAPEPFLKEAVIIEEVSQTEIAWTFTPEIPKVENIIEVPKPKEEENVVRHFLTDDLEEKVEMTESIPKSVLSPEEQYARAKERMERIQSYTSKLKSSAGLADLEKEPAYKRKNVQIDDFSHSTEEKMSRFTLSSDSEGGLRDNNSFLHDNVD
jgi:cell division protein FtsZ